MNESITETESTPPRLFASSANFGTLAEALAKAQGEIHGARKDSDNPFFHSKYADLASVWDACRGPLSKNGLAVIQLPGNNGDGMFVDSILTHSSGEWISSRLYITPVQDTPQGIGSAITYARRYGLQAIVGIAPEEDDGEAAMGRQQKREDTAKTARNTPLETKPPKAKAKPPNVFPETPPTDEIPMFNGENHENLSKRLRTVEITEERFMEIAREVDWIPKEAKAFRRMRDETAKRLLDNNAVGMAVDVENLVKAQV